MGDTESDSDEEDTESDSDEEEEEASGCYDPDEYEAAGHDEAILSGKNIMDGCRSLPEAAQRLRKHALELEKMSSACWELNSAVRGDRAFMSATGEVRTRAY